jgi:hypothetical protein
MVWLIGCEVIEGAEIPKGRACTTRSLTELVRFPHPAWVSDTIIRGTTDKRLNLARCPIRPRPRTVCEVITTSLDHLKGMVNLANGIDKGQGLKPIPIVREQVLLT